jgi:alpha-tubulin suppressor-like RCC1 family protein
LASSAASLLAVFALPPLVGAQEGPVPTVTNVQPNAGPEAGGTRVVISGTGFTSGANVKFGESTATNVTVNSASSITAVTPAGMGPAVHVQVETAGGISTTTEADHFAWRAATALGWGEDEYGQVGNSSVAHAVTEPTAAGVTGEASAVASGSGFSVALESNGTVFSFGANSSGQLGNGKSGSANNSSVPVAVCRAGVTAEACTNEHKILEEATAVAAGENFGLALRSNGTVVAWGSDVSGQLGNGKSGSANNSSVPVEVSGLGEVVAIAAGGETALALRRDGTVRAWGRNKFGELGNYDTSNANSSVPVPVCAKQETPCLAANYLKGVSSLAAGRNFSVALLQNGTVAAWGRNSGDELGVGGGSGPETCGLRNCSRVPVMVHVLSEVTAIAAGARFGLALRSNGRVMAWGEDVEGQFGNGKVGQEGFAPEAVEAMTGQSEVTAIAAGEFFSAALLKNGKVMAAGSNAYGQLGNGSTERSIVPVQVKGFTESTSATAIAANSNDVLALGTLPTPIITNVQPNAGPTAGATRVVISGTGLEGATAVHFGETSEPNCAENQVEPCFTVNSSTSLTAIAPPGTSTADVTTTVGGTPSPKSAADRFSWRSEAAAGFGDNEFGQLGNGTKGEQINSLPGAVSEKSGVVSALAAGERFGLALRAEGTERTVAAWGHTYGGVLEGGSNVPVPICATNETESPCKHDLTEVDAIGAGYEFGLAVVGKERRVVAWGRNEAGALGDGKTRTEQEDSDVPVPVCAVGATEKPCSEAHQLKGVVAVAAGAGFAVALMNDGTVVGWGFNDFGQLGTGHAGEETPVPIPVNGLSGVMGIAAGERHTLALLNDGTVMALGNNENGQLGNGGETDSSVPTEVKGLNRVSAITGGERGSFALLRNGQVMSWGENSYGELGDSVLHGPEQCYPSPVNPCSTRPVLVHNLPEATAVASSGFSLHTLALIRGGTAVAWGHNGYGQLGHGTQGGPEGCPCSAIPVSVNNLSQVSALATGEFFSLAVGHLGS